MTGESPHVSRRSRRALLAGALGGLGAWAAATAAKVEPAAAAAGDPIRMGRLNRAFGTRTELQTSTEKSGFLVRQLGGGAAIRAESEAGRALMGVTGPSGTGVWARAKNRYAVDALSENGIGVMAYGGDTGVQAIGQIGLYATGGTMAARFDGRVGHVGFYDLFEVLEPESPPGNAARLFMRDNGSGKKQLCVKFGTGAAQVVATEP
jgi:hypothetical protein